MLNRPLARACSVALLILAAAAILPGVSSAAWKQEDLPWRHRGAGALGFSQPSSGFSDTLYISAAPARADTSVAFNMLDCEQMPLFSAGLSSADSVASAYVIVAGDSTVASSINFKNTTVAVQVNYGDQESGWQSVATAYSVLATDGTKAIHIPLYENLNATTQLGIDYAVTNAIYAPRCRVIVTWGTSAAVPTARLFVKKYAGVQSINRQGPSAASFGTVK